MWLFSHFGTKSAAKAVAKCVFLAAALVLGGCQNAITDPGTVYPDNYLNLGLVGTWQDGYGGSYTISTGLDYDSGYGDSFEGGIVSVVNFTSASGVLIVQLTSVTNTTGLYGTNYTVGKYAGVYYKELTSSHICLANAIDTSYALIQIDDLNTALSTFTAGNMGTHITYWGSGYSR
ncbi:MAG: hypothetical protein LBR16_03810 [Treponema sp.]|jgi:hypothetical protein|nr:hypothetical protein [Treponema sp.]